MCSFTALQPQTKKTICLDATQGAERSNVHMATSDIGRWSTQSSDAASLSSQSEKSSPEVKHSTRARENTINNADDSVTSSPDNGKKDHESTSGMCFLHAHKLRHRRRYYRYRSVIKH